MKHIEDLFYHQCETSAREFYNNQVDAHPTVVWAFMSGAQWAFDKYSVPDLLAENKRLRQILSASIPYLEELQADESVGIRYGQALEDTLGAALNEQK